MAFSASGALGLIMRLPTAFFPIALGISGLGAFFTLAGKHFQNNGLARTGTGVLSIAATVLALEIVFYIFKILRNRRDVFEDWESATQANLLAPGFMALLVISGTLANLYPAAAIIWLAAAIGHFILLVGFVGRWCLSPLELGHY